MINFDIHTHDTITTIKIVFPHALGNPTLLLSLRLPHSQATIDLLSFTKDCLAFSKIFYKWNHTLCPLYLSGFFHLK